MPCHRLQDARTDSSSEEGSILVWALLFVMISSAMVVSHSMYLAANRRQVDARQQHAALAETYARSGLTDAMAWYQRQANQPVAEFAPQYTPDGDPPLADTMDPRLGLVREFEVRGDLWARYEVRKDEVFDISAQRGHGQPGSVWDVGSRGYLFHRRDADAPFDQGGNRVIASTYVRTEMQGVPMVPPAMAAVAVDDPVLVELGPNAMIDGGERAGIAFPAGLSAATLPPTQLLGSPPVSPLPGYDASAHQVFQMQLAQLEELCDYVVESGAGGATDSLGGGGNGGIGIVQGPGGGLRDLVRRLFGWSSSDTDCGPNTSTQRLAVVDTVLSAPAACIPVRQLLGDLADTSSLATVDYDAADWEWLRARYAAGSGQVKQVERRLRLIDRSVFFKGNVVLGPDRPLIGRALIVVDGNLQVLDGNQTFLQGLVYVTGNARIDGHFVLQGLLVVRGHLLMGNGSETAEIRYDPIAIEALKRALERYRLSRSIRPGWAVAN